MKWTTDNVWKECLAAWDFVATVRAESTLVNSGTLKQAWMQRHHPRMRQLSCSCFFCEVNERKGGITNPVERGRCEHCPGRAVDPGFNCEAPGHCWASEPIAFYHYLRKLDRKRKRL